MIVTDGRVPRFAEGALGRPIIPPFTCMGVERNGRITGAVVFNHYERTDVRVSVAGGGWTRGFLAEVGRYVFGQLGCLRMTAITESPDVAGFGIRLGGQIEGRLRDHFGAGRDGILIGILKGDYRYGYA